MKIKKSIFISSALVFATLCITFLTFGCAENKHNLNSSSSSKRNTSSEVINHNGNIIYKNKQYSFLFTLPSDWNGYTILNKTWKGVDRNGKIMATGPAIVIRNPEWTSQTPYADISLLVLSFDQLSSFQNSKFSVNGFSGGTISGGNGCFMFGTVKYVFLAPEFLNSTSLPGASDILKILYNNPLQPTNDNKLQPINYSSQPSTVTSPSANSISSDSKSNIVYTNKQYGFQLMLPSTWNRFTLVNDTWWGLYYDSQKDTDVTVAKGPIISIRNPKWTSKVPYQDISVMIFTISQWNEMQSGVFHINNAAPVNPTEITRNSTYIFALPPRYNWAYPQGYKEVEKIIGGNSLKSLTINET